METKVNYAFVGGFVLVLGAVLIAAILWLASGGSGHQRHDTYLALVDESVAGLNLAAPVKYLGVDVGKVSDIRLDPHNPQQVRLQFSILHGTPVKTDTEAVLKTQGLTGIAYIELTGGSPNAALLQAKAGQGLPQIRTKPSLSARLENVLSGVLANLDRTAANINAMVSSENRAALGRILADTSAVMQTMASQKKELASTLQNAAITSANSAKASARINAQIDTTMAKINAGSDAVKHMADQAAISATAAGKTVAGLDAGVDQFNHQTLPQLERLLAEMSVLAASLRRVSTNTEHNPSSLLRGHQPIPAGPGETSIP
jgi:phospholipid/cholesterol/gamma-HCH transport system substrate-binding protein